MSKVNIYLNFMGNTLEAFEHYKEVFGGDFLGVQRFGDIPDSPETKNMTEQEKNQIMHIELPILSNVILMGTDMVESFGHELRKGNNISLSLNVDTKQEADLYFSGLSKNGTIEMPLQDTFWGAYYGMCTDQYGVQWMINYQYPQ